MALEPCVVCPFGHNLHGLGCPLIKIPPVTLVPPSKKVPSGQEMHADNPYDLGANVPGGHLEQVPWETTKLSSHCGALQSSLVVLPFGENRFCAHGLQCALNVVGALVAGS
jgi:hypothetical protein